MNTPHGTRHRLGQHFTPQPLVKMVCELGILKPSDTVLDPACGDGAFLRGAARRLRELGCETPAPTQICGYELDSRHAADAAGNVPSANVVECDFFSREPTASFDCVVGNFPFVRQEFLSKSSDIIAKIRDEWKADFPPVTSLTGRADLYLYFFFHAARFLKSGGRMAVISGNSWLNAPYGAPLRKLVLERLGLRMVIESRAEIWFPDTAVNAVVTVLDNRPPESDVVFAVLDAPLKDAVPDGQANGGIVLPVSARVRRVKLASLEAADNWNWQLRAPGSYFEIMSLAAKHLRPLSTAARIKRGVTTGLNRFFLIEKDEAEKSGLEPECLRPIIVSLRGVDSLILQDKHAQHYLLLIDKPREQLEGTAVLRYIEQFEQSEHFNPQAPSLASRDLWYRLPSPTASDFIIPRFRRERHFSPSNPKGLLVGDTVFTATMRQQADAKLYAAVLNSTLFHLCAEVTGRDNMGGGFITTYGPEISALPVPDAAVLRPHAEELLDAFKLLAKRPVLNMEHELLQDDRRRLDEVLWCALALPANLIDRMYHDFSDVLRRRREYGVLWREHGRR